MSVRSILSLEKEGVFMVYGGKMYLMALPRTFSKLAGFNNYLNRNILVLSL